MNWRERLARLVTPKGSSHRGIELRETEQYGGTKTNLADLLDEGDPLLMFFCHSDCDGEIAADDCAPLADALQALVDKSMPARGMYDDIRPATERFIKGLRLAASLGEPVDFH